MCGRPRLLVDQFFPVLVIDYGNEWRLSSVALACRASTPPAKRSRAASARSAATTTRVRLFPVWFAIAVASWYASASLMFSGVNTVPPFLHFTTWSGASGWCRGGWRGAEISKTKPPFVDCKALAGSSLASFSFGSFSFRCRAGPEMGKAGSLVGARPITGSSVAGKGKRRIAKPLI